MSSSITLDTFVMNDKFLVTWQAPRSGAVEVVAVTGKIHPYFQFAKDAFSLTFILLTQYQKEDLEAIVLATGAGVFHTATYVTPEGTLIYDGSTSSGFQNTKKRVRGKLYIPPQDIQFEHFRGVPNKFIATMTCLEQ